VNEVVVYDEVKPKQSLALLKASLREGLAVYATLACKVLGCPEYTSKISWL
jgi:hypothetical protein